MNLLEAQVEHPCIFNKFSFDMLPVPGSKTYQFDLACGTYVGTYMITWYLVPGNQVYTRYHWIGEDLMIIGP